MSCFVCSVFLSSHLLPWPHHTLHLQSLSYPSSSVTCWLIDLSLLPVSWACLSSFFFFSGLPIQFQHWYHFLQLTILSLIWHSHSWRKKIMSLCWCGFKQKVSCANMQSGKISKVYTCPLSWVVLSGHWGPTGEEGKTRAAQWDPRDRLSREPAGIAKPGQPREQIEWRTLRLERGKRAFILPFWSSD